MHSEMIDDKFTIKSVWGGWANSDKCPLCRKEGKDIACNWKKGHTRANGIMLESGISYCNECIGTKECEEHWKKWWQDQWKKCEKSAEENWKNYGVYTNVGGGMIGPSRHFAYAKDAEGNLRPYSQVFPNCPKDKIEEKLKNYLYRNYDINSEQKILEIDKMISEAVNLDLEYKKLLHQKVLEEIKRTEEYKKKEKNNEIYVD